MNPLRTSRRRNRHNNAVRISPETQKAIGTGGMLLRFGLLAGFLLEGWQPLSAEILYSVTDLGTLGGYSSFGYGINNQGQVTGGHLRPMPTTMPFSTATAGCRTWAP